MRDSDQLQMQVTAELKRVREYGLDQLDALGRVTSEPKVAPTPLLERAAQRIPGYTDRLTRSAAIRLLLTHEIPLIEENPCRGWLPLSFGLTDETRGKISKQRRRAALEVSGSHNLTSFERSDGGDEVTGIGILAAQIVVDCLREERKVFGQHQDAGYTLTKTTPQAHLPSIHLDPTYVVREDRYAKIDQALADGCKVVGLAGEGGMGKTTLIKHYMHDRFPGQPFIFADFRSSYDLVTSLHHSFTSLGYATDGLSADTALIKLLDIFAQGELCPPYIVLDNLDRVEQSKRLEPYPATATVFLTTRDEFVLPSNSVKITVQELDPAQAEAAARIKLPDVSTEELSILRHLKGHILALDMICSAMREAHTSEAREHFTRALDHEAVHTLNIAASSRPNAGRQALPTIYAEIIRSLERDVHTSMAVRLLELAVANALWGEKGHSGSASVKRTLIRFFTDIERDSPLAQGLYENALVTLLRFHLVRIDPLYAKRDGIDVAQSESIATYLSCNPDRLDFHPLALEILQQLFAHDLPDRCGMLVTDLMSEARYRLSEVERIFTGCEAGDGEVRQIIELAEFVATISRWAPRVIRVEPAWQSIVEFAVEVTTGIEALTPQIEENEREARRRSEEQARQLLEYMEIFSGHRLCRQAVSHPGPLFVGYGLQGTLHSLSAVIAKLSPAL